jgi:hypothetical protein
MKASAAQRLISIGWKEAWAKRSRRKLRPSLSGDAADISKDSHVRLLFLGGLGASVGAPTMARSVANPEELRQGRGQPQGERSVLSC